MSDFSVLFDTAEQPPLCMTEPDCFHDLNLDQVVEHLTEDREDYELDQFLWTPLSSVEAIGYRHEVFHDLDRPPVHRALEQFAEAMRLVRQRANQSAALRHPLQQQRWHVDGALTYVDAVEALTAALETEAVHSTALKRVSDWLRRYVASRRFTSLRNDVDAVERSLTAVAYCVDIQADRVTVRRYDDEADYSAQVAATFERFRQGDVDDHRVKFTSWPDMNHIETAVLERVARLFPDTFTLLDQFSEKHADYVDPSLAGFDRELQFYLSYQQLRLHLEDAGLATSYPRLSKRSKHVFARETYDLALAVKLAGERRPVVTNDVELSGKERILVVSGPNQGGKTTLARTFGQLHYLARLGLPVPGSATQVLLCDAVFTHFEREESHQDLSGKLEDDLLRIHDILRQATTRSVVVLNEIFTSTTLEDAIDLGCRILAEIVRLDLLCVCVSFVDEYASVSDTTVSMVSTVSPDDPSERTLKLERRPPDGTAHAMALARKYRLTFSELRDRLAS